MEPPIHNTQKPAERGESRAEPRVNVREDIDRKDTTWPPHASLVSRVFLGLTILGGAYACSAGRRAFLAERTDLRGRIGV